MPEVARLSRRATDPATSPDPDLVHPDAVAVADALPLLQGVRVVPAPGLVGDGCLVVAGVHPVDAADVHCLAARVGETLGGAQPTADLVVHAEEVVATAAADLVDGEGGRRHRGDQAEGGHRADGEPLEVRSHDVLLPLL